MSLESTRFSVVDIETTGLDIKDDEILSFACVPMLGFRILVGEAYHTLIRPTKYDVLSMKYHGISERDLEDAPAFEEVAQRIAESADGVWVGHSVEFDYEFLRKYYKRLKIEFRRQCVDIVCVERWLGRKIGRMGEDLTLEGLMTRYGLKESYRHNALADAFFSAQIFQMELHKFADMGIHTLKALKKKTDSCRYASW